jgi:hypothetical protein
VLRITLLALTAVMVTSCAPVGGRTSAATLDVPTVGDDLGAVVQTCERAQGRATPTTARACLAWGGDTPVNVVVVLRAPDQLAGLAPSWVPAWRPAQGRWLVARGRILSECGTGYQASTLQLEQRLDPVTRHHLKFVQLTCADGLTAVAFGSAHTDHYDLRACRGDHAIALDAARDAFAATVRRTTPAAQVTYRDGHSGTARYDGGCGRRLASDGRVAYVLVG